MNKHVDIKNYQFEAVTDLLTTLSDPVRQQIVMLFINNKEYCVTDIASNFKISRPTVSHHLNLMKRSKVLISRKDGKEVYYSFNKNYVIDSLKLVIEFLKGCC